MGATWNPSEYWIAVARANVEKIMENAMEQDTQRTDDQVNPVCTDAHDIDRTDAHNFDQFLQSALKRLREQYIARCKHNDRIRRLGSILVGQLRSDIDCDASVEVDNGTDRGLLGNIWMLIDANDEQQLVGDSLMDSLEHHL